MPKKHPRIVREEKTIQVMIGIFCRDRHGTRDALCPDCAELLAYAKARLEKCPLQEKKTTCANCSVHCYKPGMRNRVKDVMRYAGRRMVARHPYLALMHFVDGFREAKRGN